jgi:hypothetical protein
VELERGARRLHLRVQLGDDRAAREVDDVRAGVVGAAPGGAVHADRVVRSRHGPLVDVDGAVAEGA